MAYNRDDVRSEKIIAFNGLISCMKELYFIKQWLNHNPAQANAQTRMLADSICLDTPFHRTERSMINKDDTAPMTAAGSSLQGLNDQDRTYMRLIEDIYHGTNNLTLHMQNQVVAWSITKAEIETKIGEYYFVRGQIMEASGMSDEFLRDLVPPVVPKTPRVNF